MSDLSPEYAEGRRAFQDGLTFQSNPYEHGSKWARLWHDGWDDANGEDRDEKYDDWA